MNKYSILINKTMDISKVSVVDPRIVQHKPKYAVEKGALSVTNQTFTAIANSSSQQTFQVQVPSENVFCDRAVDWVNTVNVLVSLSVDAGASGTVLARPGANFSLAPFPVSQTVSTMTATINDQTVTVNTSDVLPQILRLADLAKTRMQRTCPTMLDKYYAVQNGVTVPNSPVGAWSSAFDPSDVPCGSWGKLSFYAGSGTALANGLPTLSSTISTATVVTFGVKFSTAEKLVLPPFIFSDEDELSTGLFGVQNIQFTANFNAPTRAIRMTAAALSGITYTSGVLPSVAWDSAPPSGGSSPFSEAKLQVQFLTPSLDVPLPAKSVVPWMEFPRYISTGAAPPSGGPNVVYTVSSQTITLPSIPDLLVIYMKPQQYSSPTQADWCMPVTKISINFDNFSGLLANHSQYQLYKMSVQNGLDMDFDEWSGAAWTATSASSALTALVGGPLVLRPGRDFALSTGQAPGLVGNFTLQFDLTVDNTVAQSPANVPLSIYTVTANSGFFETIKGSSRILKGVVTEQDILSAPVGAVAEPLERLVGAAKHHHSKVHHSKSHKGMHAYMRG